MIHKYHDIGLAMPKFNLIEYSYVYSKSSGSLWQYYRGELAFDNNDTILCFPANSNTSITFKFKEKITGETGNNGKKDNVPLKYLSNFWRKLEMQLINCEISLMLTWSEKSFKCQHFQ